jgi:sulfoxide reductase heme-binding subunit YedZ
MSPRPLIPPSARGTAGGSPPFRLSGRGSAAVFAVLGLIVLVATDQILPPTTDRQAELRFWLAGRATGLVAFGLLTVQVLVGLVMSHPHNKATWKVSKRIFPWHEHLWVFVMAFLAIHILSLVADPKSGVDIVGAVVPGMSEYRNGAVALGTVGLYALLLTALTARYTKLLPPGAWLRLHRVALVVFGLAWAHGVLAGTDSAVLRLPYVIAGVLVTLAGAYRYWVVRRPRTIAAGSAVEVART